MQSTGHSSMQDLSRTSTQGCAMMYVTSELLFRHYPGGSGASQYPGPGQVCREGGRVRARGRQFHRPAAGYQLSWMVPAGGAPASRTQPWVPAAARHWYPPNRTWWMPYLLALVTSQDATSQPSFGWPIRTCMVWRGPGAASSAVAWPKVLVSPSVMRAMSGWCGPAAPAQQYTACPCSPVNAPAISAAIRSYWMYADPSALRCTA